MTDPTIFDPSAALRRGISSLQVSINSGVTLMSESTIDATLLLHSIGYEPVDFVFGVAAQSFPFQVWNSGKEPGFSQFPRGPVPKATTVFDAAFTRAKAKVRLKATNLGASGVVDSTLKVTLKGRYILVEVRGTAIRRIGDKAKVNPHHPPFVSDVTAKSLVGLTQMGFLPSDYVAGYGFSAVTFAKRPNFTQNAEITTLTQAIYESREAAVERLQRAAQNDDVVGVVGVRTLERRTWQLGIEVVMFGVTGTTVVRRGVAVEPNLLSVLSLDNPQLSFDPIVTHKEVGDRVGGDSSDWIIEKEVSRGARFLANRSVTVSLIA